MSPLLRRLLPALLTVLVVAALAWVGAAPSAPQGASSQGWTAGKAAAGMADALRVPDPVTVEIPAAVAERVNGDTALFYFSPTCPHCQHAMPEINALATKGGGLSWLGVSTGSATDEELADFKKTYKPAFDIVVDADRAFTRALGARGTPSLYLVRPAPEASTTGTVLLFEAYTPWRRGLGGYLLLRRHPEAPFRDFQGYQSDATCAACHTEEMGSWLLTHHAVAYRTLYHRQRAEDLACVGCHVTGLGQPGGFQVGDHSSPLVDVSCEACHGPSGPHDGERTDARQVCESCHDAKHSVAFSLEKGLPLIDHYKVNALSDAEIEARLTALARGEAERPLLAFPEGPTLGADACLSCHKAEHRSWQKDPHSRAMRNLPEPDRKNVECVSCHATATASGPPPTSLEGFRAGEGVGCEACHGPGGEHVKAPTKDNIVGLGESCPECVIESICTSCHTPAWDPGWDLKARLGAARHDAQP